MTTIITALLLGIFAVAALLIMRHDRRAERRARQDAIDEATAPWRALYEERESALRELREEHERTVTALRRELRRADQEIARWNIIGMAIKGRDLALGQAGIGAEPAGNQRKE